MTNEELSKKKIDKMMSDIKTLCSHFDFTCDKCVTRLREVLEGKWDKH